MRDSLSEKFLNIATVSLTMLVVKLYFYGSHYISHNIDKLFFTQPVIWSGLL